MQNEVYEPGEDSYLILNYVREYAKGRVLDMGTGTGILAINASQKADFVYGIDINPDAIDYAISKSKHIDNIKFMQSNMFDYFRQNPERFDLIIFNPPYLPEDRLEPLPIRLATTGGKKGYEVIAEFLKQSSAYLKEDGKILLLFSSLTNKAKVHELIENFGYNYQKLAEQKFFFETLYVYLIEKSEFLNQLEKYNIKDIQKLTKGHRGVIYTGYYNHAKVAIKTKNPESKAVGRMINEARWLKLLNRQQIGPEIFAHQEDFFIYKFIEGTFFPEFIISATKEMAKKVIVDVFNQCYKMDELKINKEEMQNPYKHIIVGEKTTLLDFERAHKTEKPHNANQFCQYITSSRISSILKDKGFNIDKLRVIQKAKIYKKSINKRNFDNLIKEIK